MLASTASSFSEPTKRMYRMLWSAERFSFWCCDDNSRGTRDAEDDYKWQRTGQKQEEKRPQFSPNSMKAKGRIDASAYSSNTDSVASRKYGDGRTHTQTHSQSSARNSDRDFWQSSTYFFLGRRKCFHLISQYEYHGNFLCFRWTHYCPGVWENMKGFKYQKGNETYWNTNWPKCRPKRKITRKEDTTEK